MGRNDIVVSAADLEAWCAVAADLSASPGVHRPSGFSAALAAALPELDGATVIDAGSGAGLISIAALRRGAGHVVALDHDLRALGDTSANVERLLGAEARTRLSLWEASWAHLRLLSCDLTVINPPQRPADLLARTDPAERHLHEGAGDDGLGALRLLLSQATTPAVLAITTSLLRPASASLAVGGYGAPTLHANAEVDHDAIWFAEREWQVVAVDISDTALQRAREEAASRGVGDRIGFVQCDLEERFPDGTFDLISAQFLHSKTPLDRTATLGSIKARRLSYCRQ